MNSSTEPQQEGGIDQAWLRDYTRACGELACLYATAYDELSTAMGLATALALAPVLLPKIVATAEQEAGVLAERRRTQLLLEEQWEQQRQQQAPEAAAAVIITAENPW